MFYRFGLLSFLLLFINSINEFKNKNFQLLLIFIILKWLYVNKIVAFEFLINLTNVPSFLSSSNSICLIYGRNKNFSISNLISCSWFQYGVNSIFNKFIINNNRKITSLDFLSSIGNSPEDIAFLLISNISNIPIAKKIHIYIM